MHHVILSFFTMQELLKQIEIKNSYHGFKILNPASDNKILELEHKIGCKLPEDFIQFYSLCNGFECLEDIFNFLSVDTILANNDYGDHWFLFAEYMIFSDSWGLRKNEDGDFEFFSSANTISSNSLAEFLQAFSKGNVFGNDGIYEWEKKHIKDNPIIQP